MIETLSAAEKAPRKLGMRWWTGRGFWATFVVSIKSQILFRITHFQAFESSSSLSISPFDFSAIVSRASASRLSLSASYAASSNAASFRMLLLLILKIEMVFLLGLERELVFWVGLTLSVNGWHIRIIPEESIDGL